MTVRDDSTFDVPRDFGDWHIGRFRLSVRPCVFDRSPFDKCKRFEIFLSEWRISGSYYVDLAEDPRFLILGPGREPPDEVKDTHAVWLQRKHVSQPLWNVSVETLHLLLNKIYTANLKNLVNAPSPAVDPKKQAMVRRLKAAANSSTRQEPVITFMSRSSSHFNALLECKAAINTVQQWTGMPADLEAFVLSTEASLRSAIVNADRFVSLFPPGSSHAFGKTSGLPDLDRETGTTSCHECGKPLHALGEPSLGEEDKPVFFVYGVGRDVLLFASHRSCWDGVVESARKDAARLSHDRHCAKYDRPGEPLPEKLALTSNELRVEEFREVPADEWLLLLDAKTVLSS